MPNWCSNILHVEGDKFLLEGLLKAYTNEHGDLSFNRVVPMPPELDIEEGSRGQNGYDVLAGEWRRLASHEGLIKKLTDEFGEATAKCITSSRQTMIGYYQEAHPDCLELGQRYIENTARHGHRTWWTWRVLHWGTKWDIDGPNDDARHDGSPEAGFLVWHFDTAWSPPVPIVEAMGKAWPSLSFTLDYLEDGAWFAGRVTVSNGQVEDEARDVLTHGREVFGREYDDYPDDGEAE